METSQHIQKFLYPVIMWFSKLTKKNTDILSNKLKTEALVSFYSLKYLTNEGKEISFKQYRNKKVLLVNVASFCGYTSQYEGLEKLYKENEGRLVILGFPANNFGEQEPGKDEDIASFCRLDYGVTFPIFKKSSVSKPDQNPVYTWLSSPKLNGWNDQAPTWNFCKYIVDEQGRLTHFFGAAIAPDTMEIQEAIGSNGIY